MTENLTGHYEVEGMKLLARAELGCKSWAELLTETPSPAVARAVGALKLLTTNDRHAYQIAHTLYACGLLADWDGAP